MGMFKQPKTADKIKVKSKPPIKSKPKAELSLNKITKYITHRKGRRESESNPNNFTFKQDQDRLGQDDKREIETDATGEEPSQFYSETSLT